MKSVVLGALLMFCITPFCLAASHRGGLGSQTDFKNMSPAQVLSLLQNAQAIRVDDHSYFDKVTLNACNGKKPGWFNRSFEQSCDTVANVIQMNPGNPSQVLPVMQALLRGCGLYAASSETSVGDERSGETCGLLGTLFFVLGNVPAARAVWDEAPGCRSHDMNGRPVDGCIREIVGQSGGMQPWAYLTTPQQRLHAYDSDFGKLVAMARESCSSTRNPYACRFAASQGDQIDMAEVQREQAARSRAVEQAQKENREEQAEKTRESNERFNAVMGALQSMSGADTASANSSGGSASSSGKSTTPSGQSQGGCPVNPHGSAGTSTPDTGGGSSASACAGW